MARRLSFKNPIFSSLQRMKGIYSLFDYRLSYRSAIQNNALLRCAWKQIEQQIKYSTSIVDPSEMKHYFVLLLEPICRNE